MHKLSVWSVELGALWCLYSLSGRHLHRRSEQLVCRLPKWNLECTGVIGLRSLSQRSLERLTFVALHDLSPWHLHRESQQLLCNLPAGDLELCWVERLYVLHCGCVESRQGSPLA